MKTMVVVELAILVAAGACGNAQGATPDAGSSAYSSRQQLHCNTVNMSDPNATDVSASCTSPDDLPVTGSCSNPGPPVPGGDAVLARNEPTGWDANFQLQGVTAGWLCSWTIAGQPVHVPGGKATICCAVKTP